MSEARLRYRDEEITLPVLTGTYGDAAVDISQLRSGLGLVTFDRGFGNTAEGKGAVSFIDGEAGFLSYRGYPIEQLAAHASFLEVAFLLQFGELPSGMQLRDYEGAIKQYAHVPGGIRRLIESFPRTGHPMQILASSVSALASYFADDLNPLHEDAVEINARRLIATTPSLVAWSHRYRVSQPYVDPRDDLDYVSNFLTMVFAGSNEDYSVNPVVARALNLLLILHADHGQNCSSTAVRLVASSHSSIFNSVAAGIHALAGPLHGGANQSVLEMLEELHTSGTSVDVAVRRAKDRKNTFRLMGFGHRVYKNFDPRARILKETANEVLEALGIDDPLLQIARELEEVALSDDYFVDRKLYPNVDFYSGIIYRAIGFPAEMLTALFALARMPGWIAQYRDLLSDPETRIFRPRQLYVGPGERKYVPADQR